IKISENTEAYYKNACQSITTKYSNSDYQLVKGMLDFSNNTSLPSV
ncbi:6350_t:CDS:2, partial [Gigaspora margarita]